MPECTSSFELEACTAIIRQYNLTTESTVSSKLTISGVTVQLDAKAGILQIYAYRYFDGCNCPALPPPADACTESSALAACDAITKEFAINTISSTGPLSSSISVQGTKVDFQTKDGVLKINSGSAGCSCLRLPRPPKFCKDVEDTKYEDTVCSALLDKIYDHEHVGYSGEFSIEGSKVAFKTWGYFIQLYYRGEACTCSY